MTNLPPAYSLDLAAGRDHTAIHLCPETPFTGETLWNIWIGYFASHAKHLAPASCFAELSTEARAAWNGTAKALSPAKLNTARHNYSLIDEANFRHRHGRFRAARERLFYAHPVDTAFFGNFVIYGCRISDGDYMEFLAISELFDVIDQGEIPPLYEITITKRPSESGGYTYTFEARRIHEQEPANG